MGLDFYVVKVKNSDIVAAGDAAKAIKDWDFDTFDNNILAYGRKTWELVHYLGCATSEDCISELKLSDWVNLMEAISPISPYFDEIIGAYNEYYAEDFEDLESLARPRFVRLYEKWYKKHFDEYPQLGYDFSVGYMKNFWEAADKVLKYLEDPEYKVFMIASY